MKLKETRNKRRGGADEAMALDGDNDMLFIAIKYAEGYPEWAGGIEFVKRLLLRKNNAPMINYVSSAGFTPLHLAVIKNYIDIVAMLLERGADVNKTIIDGKTPLHFAKSKEVCILLVNAGANVNATDEDGQKPSFYVEDIETRMFLLEKEKQATSISGGTTHIIYNNRKYKVHVGQKGGHYILVGEKKKRIYV